MRAELISDNLENLKKGLAQDAYMCHKQSCDMKTSAKSVLPKSFLGYLKLLLKPDSFIGALRLNGYIKSYENKRLSYNLAFVERETIKRADFFKNIAGKALDQQQIQAVIPNEDNTLVIAGAGSGKTLTIEAKVKYLVECLNVQTDKILPISFTNKSAASMRERINTSGIEPKTFHAFGLTVLKSVDEGSPNVFDDDKLKPLIKKFIKDLSCDDSFLAGLTNFFKNYIKIPKSEFEFDSLGEYIQYLKDQNYTTYKKVAMPYRGMETYRNEVVKSVQECIIANFLLFNNVEYEYEAPYDFPLNPYVKVKYLPDFTIKTDSGKIYLEHFGISRDDDVPAFFAKPGESHETARRKYLDGIKWKRDMHNHNETTLIETYSYEFMEDGFLDKLAARLTVAGVELRPMSNDETWEVIQESGNEEVEAFIALVTTFLTLMKSNHFSIKDLRSRNRKINKNDFLRERTDQFLLLFGLIFDLYENYLHKNGQIDFNDMISKATEYISDGYYRQPLDYVIIDEFQDMSVGRYKLLVAIKKQNPNVKFYCVGDDWQSIYRFAGSDIALFRDFENYFGYTLIQKIETTYRFNEPLIETSSNFILKNPNQTKKHLVAPKLKGPTTLSIIESMSTGDDTELLIDAINELVTQHGLRSDEKVYLISRYNYDINRIRNLSKQFKVNIKRGTIEYAIPDGSRKGENICLEFVTAHRSKGLEAPYIIIIMNCNSGRMGFPSERADDPLLNLLLSRADQFENGEERRLFYVAMTRAKKHVILLTETAHKSKFIKELQDTEDDRDNRCPICKEGDLVLRNSKDGRSFYGCTNFGYGCDYTEPVSNQKKF